MTWRSPSRAKQRRPAVGRRDTRRPKPASDRPLPDHASGSPLGGYTVFREKFLGATGSAQNAHSRCHFGSDDGDGFFNPASRAFARPRLSAYSLPSIGATCGGSLSRYGRPIPSSCSCASIHFHKFSLELHRCARVSPFTLTRSAASPWP